jgi:hypothetical protein
MARALYGHIGGGSDPSLSMEIVRLRRRVADLESELTALREANDTIAPSLEVELHQLAETSAPALA